MVPDAEQGVQQSSLGEFGSGQSSESGFQKDLALISLQEDDLCSFDSPKPSLGQQSKSKSSSHPGPGTRARSLSNLQVSLTVQEDLRSSPTCSELPSISLLHFGEETQIGLSAEDSPTSIKGSHASPFSSAVSGGVQLTSFKDIGGVSLATATDHQFEVGHQHGSELLSQTVQRKRRLTLAFRPPADTANFAAYSANLCYVSCKSDLLASGRLYRGASIGRLPHA